MGRTINIQPLSRIEGHASVEIKLDDAGNVADAITHFTSMRGFEKFVEGKPAEEAGDFAPRFARWLDAMGLDHVPLLASVVG